MEVTMIGVTDLWLPILVSAVAVFIVSSLIHMVVRYHKPDWAKVPGEDMVTEAIRKAGVPAGDYMFPHCSDMSELKKPEVMEKFKRGPVGTMTILPAGISMGKNLALWFVYTLFVGIAVALIVGRTRWPGAPFMQIFKLAGAVAFLVYFGAEPTNSIWKGRKWSTTVKFLIDGILYGATTGAVFGYFWPE
jgi:hypothetical protein